MKRFMLIALFLMCIVGTVSAYGVYLTCPSNVQVGAPITCTISGDFPAGTAFNLVLYQSQYTATEVSSQTITSQGNQKNQTAIFDTSGLPGGNYKVELQVPATFTPRSDSVTLQPYPAGRPLWRYHGDIANDPEPRRRTQDRGLHSTRRCCRC